MSALGERLAAVDDGIREAAAAAGRDPAGITRIVVTKFHPVSLIRELLELGVRDVGENRHQEAQQKAAELAGEPLTWHFVGQLQSKKARQAVRYARVIHSVDRDSLVDALAGIGPSGSDDGSARDDAADARVDVFVQVDLSGQPGRGGVQPDGVLPLAERVLALPALRLAGVMAVAPLDAEPRRAFARVRELSESLRRLAPDADAISTGMSGDYRDAVLEGATHLRIGTAITGNRPTAG